MFGKFSFLFLVVASIVLIIPGISFSGDLLRVIANIIGLFGVLILFWQIALGSKFLILLLGGDFVFFNNIHKRLGKYGVLLIFFHPILLFFFYNSYKINLIFDSISSTFDFAKMLGVIAISILLFIWVTSAVLRKRLEFNIWKTMHLLVYAVLPLVLLHSFFITIRGTNTYLTLYWIALAMGYILIAITRILGVSGVLSKKYKIIGSTKITEEIVKLDFEPERGKIEIKPGQFVFLQLNRFREAHPFTVSHINSNKTFSITAKSFGSFSKKLLSLKIGESVFIDGAFGVFTKEGFTEPEDIVLIAGGVGITPFIELIKHNTKIPSRKLYLFFGNNIEKNIAFNSELQFLSKLYKNFEIINVISNDPLYKGEKGYITKKILEKYLEKDLTNYRYFICGPQALMDSAMEFLQKSGVSYTKMHSEKFSL